MPGCMLEYEEAGKVGVGAAGSTLLVRGRPASAKCNRRSRCPLFAKYFSVCCAKCRHFTLTLAISLTLAFRHVYDTDLKSDVFICRIVDVELITES